VGAEKTNLGAVSTGATTASEKSIANIIPESIFGTPRQNSVLFRDERKPWAIA
jgi:hypothetical protein